MDKLNVLKLKSIRLDGRLLSMGHPILSLTSQSQLNFSVRRKGNCRPLRFTLQPTEMDSVSFWLQGDRPFIRVKMKPSEVEVIKLREKLCGLAQLSTDLITDVEFDFTLAEEFGDKRGAEGLLVRMAVNANRQNLHRIAAEGEIPPDSVLDLSAKYRDPERIPTEMWAKILSFLSIPDRMKVERVDKQFAEASKTTWSLVKIKKLRIDRATFNTAAKVATLLNRAGPHAEEICTQRHIPQEFDSEVELGQLCPELKTLTFESGSSLSLVGTTRLLTGTFSSRIDRLLTSLTKLERLEFFQVISTSNDEVAFVLDLPDFITGLINVPSLRELHVVVDVQVDSALEELCHLQQLRVLSINISPGNFDVAINSICKLAQLEELHIRLGYNVTQLFTLAVVTRLTAGLTHLRSLVLVFTREDIFLHVGSVEALVGQLTQLRTLVLVTQLPVFDLDGVDLSPFAYRDVPINVFVVDQISPVFVGSSAQVRVVPMPNGQRGETVEFLSSYTQNGFDFAANKCLQMVLRSNANLGHQWDFFTGDFDDADELNSDMSGGPLDPYLMDDFDVGFHTDDEGDVDAEDFDLDDDYPPAGEVDLDDY